MSSATEIETTSRPAGVPRRRAVLLGGAIAVAALAVGGGVSWAVATSAAPDPGAASDPSTHGLTDEIVRGDLEGTTTASGTLRFAEPRTIQAGGDGIVTDLPTSGEVIGTGAPLYAIGDTPVYLLHGELPAWRDLVPGAKGDDVRQLQENLTALGYPVPVDGTLGHRTQQAIRDWQKDNGLERTGTVPLGAVVFAEGDVRIGTVTAAVGDAVTPGSVLFESTSTTQIVDLTIALADQQLAALGTEVTVRLPGAVDIGGTVTAVGTPTENEDSEGQGQAVIPVTVSLDETDAAAQFQQASVTVDIPTERRADVLSVPVSALVALTPDQFGVEIVEPDGTIHRVPVTTGLFAAGRVEISGDRLRAGMHVSVPQR